MTTFANRLPVGAGSRGGRWHEPLFRRAYHRAWRAAHPEYREREALRNSIKRALARGDGSPSSVARLAPVALPAPASRCLCDCECREIVVVRCGFCMGGMHREDMT